MPQDLSVFESECIFLDQRHSSYALLTIEQINDVKEYIASNINKDNNPQSIEYQYAKSIVDSIREKVLASKESKIRPSDLYQNLDAFSKNAKDIFEKLLTVELPKSLNEIVKSMLSIDDYYSVMLIIEYFKFIVLKHYFPTTTYCPWMISKVWAEHFCISMNYQSMCKNIFGKLAFTVSEYRKPPKTDFEELYNTTLANYETLFNQKPPELVWKPYEVEEELQNTNFYEVNLFRMVVYYHYEHYMKFNPQQEAISKSKKTDNVETTVVASTSISTRRTNLNKYIVSDSAQLKSKVIDNSIIQLLQINNYLRNNSKKDKKYHDFLWRKNYPKELFQDSKSKSRIK